jgi:hypothetical protein
MVTLSDGIYPRPTRVMRHQVGEWEPVEEEAVAA